MNNLKTLEEKYLELGKEIEALKCEYVYPIFKRNITSGMIVKFTALTESIVAWRGESMWEVGYFAANWANHTNSNVWEDVAYDSERDLWDGQPVYAWDDNYTHAKNIRFYDPINKRVFSAIGKSVGPNWDNYEAVLPEHYTPWILEAFKTLDRSELNVTRSCIKDITNAASINIRKGRRHDERAD